MENLRSRACALGAMGAKEAGRRVFSSLLGAHVQRAPEQSQSVLKVWGSPRRVQLHYCLLFVISLHSALCGLRPTAPVDLLWSGSVAFQTSMGTSWCSPNFSADDLLSSFLKHFSCFLQPNFLRGFLLLLCRFSVFSAYSSSTSDF